MNKLFITLISLLTLLVFLYLSGIVSFYSQTPAATNFNGANALIAFDSNGDLKSIPVANINAGINAAIKGTADSLNKDLSNVAARSYSNETRSRRNGSAMTTLASKTDVANQISAAKASVDRSLNGYVKKGQRYKIYNNDNNQILLKWGKNIETDGYTDSTEDYRYFNIRD